jgi:hypothetical protein
MLKIVLLDGILSIAFFSFANVFGQLEEVEIPSKFSTFTNDGYGINLNILLNGESLKIEFQMIMLLILLFLYLLQRYNLKSMIHTKILKKMDTRILIFLDYSFIVLKLDLNFALDNAISSNMDTQSEATSGFKKFEVLESNTNSKKLDSKKVYELVFQAERKGDTFKYFTLGTIINDNQVLGINLKAPL